MPITTPNKRDISIPSVEELKTKGFNFFAKQYDN